MAAHLAVRSENNLELEKEGLSAKTLNLKPACSGDYTGKPHLSQTSYVSARAVADRQTHTQTDTQDDYSNPRACAERY